MESETEKEVFVCCASVVLCLCAMIVTYRTYNAQACGWAFWKSLLNLKWLWNALLPQRSEHLSRKICERKTQLARKFAWHALGWCIIWLASVLEYILSGRPLWTNAASRWCLFLVIAFTMIPTHFPSILLYKHSLDVSYVLAQLYVAFLVSAWASNEHQLVIVNFILFLVIGVPTATFAKNVLVVLVCQTGLFVANTIRALTETWEMHSETPSLSHPRTLVLFSFCFIPIAAVVFRLTDTLLKRDIESEMRANDKQIQLNAAFSLLELTCDSVFEIDPSLRLQTNNSNLAAMLLRSSGMSLEGALLTDFIARNEAKRATEILLQGCAEGKAHAFHTHLVDSYSNQFRTEIFQVKYTKMNGKKCHLIGLRDFMDLKSLAGGNATDAITDLENRDKFMEDWKSHRSRCQTCRTPVASRVCHDSYPDDHDDHSEKSSPESSAVGQPVSSSGIVERRLHLTEKESFLEINMLSETVGAATAPFVSLVGLPLTEVFATDISCQLFQNMCRDARNFMEAFPGGLPDQIANFHKMPLFVANSVVEVSGVMKVCKNQKDDLKVLLCCVADSSKWRGTTCTHCRVCSQLSLWPLGRVCWKVSWRILGNAEVASCDESQEHLELGSRSNFDEPPGPPIEALIATSWSWGSTSKDHVAVIFFSKLGNLKSDFVAEWCELSEFKHFLEINLWQYLVIHIKESIFGTRFLSS